MEKIILILILICIMLACCIWATVGQCAVTVDLDIIAQIESGGRPGAYNARTGATGLYQIRKICLEDYNQYHKGGEYVLADMFNQVKAWEVSNWYLHVRIPQLLRSVAVPVTLEHVLYAYNAGAGTVGKWYKGERKLPKETTDYYQKYLMRKR